MFLTKWSDSALSIFNTNCTFVAFTVSSAVYYILLVIRVKFLSITTEPCVPTYLIHNACTHIFTMQLRWPLTAFVTRLCAHLRLCRCAGKQCVPLHNYVKAQTVYRNYKLLDFSDWWHFSNRVNRIYLLFVSGEPDLLYQIACCSQPRECKYSPCLILVFTVY